MHFICNYKNYSYLYIVKQKQNDMNPSIKSSEEFKGEVTLFLSNGHEVKFETEKLIQYIEKKQLNHVCENVGTGLVCDPNSEDVYNDYDVDADKYIDDNFDAVVLSYYSNVILKA